MLLNYFITIYLNFLKIIFFSISTFQNCYWRKRKVIASKMPEACEEMKVIRVLERVRSNSEGKKLEAEQ